MVHNRTSQVKLSNFDMVTNKYDIFKIMKGELIQNFHTRFTSIINELCYLGNVIKLENLSGISLVSYRILGKAK